MQVCRRIVYAEKCQKRWKPQKNSSCSFASTPRQTYSLFPIFPSPLHNPMSKSVLFSTCVLQPNSDKIWSWFWMVFKLLINSYLLIQGCCQRDGCQPNFNSFEILTGKLASASKIQRTYGFVCSILQGLFFFVLKHLLIIAYIYILCLTMFLLSTNVWLVSKDGSF